MSTFPTTVPAIVKEPTAGPSLRTWPLKHGLVALAVGTAATVATYALLDDALFQFASSRKLPGDFVAIVRMSEVFAHGAGVAFILLTLISVRPKNWRRLLVVASVAISCGVAADIVKLLVRRFRPDAMPVDGMFAAQSFQGLRASTLDDLLADHAHALQSFPSAHTATAFGFAIGLSWCYGRGKTAFFTFAALAGLQRIVAGAHWPSDVVAGTTLAFIVAPAVIMIAQRRWPELCPVSNSDA